MKATKEERAYIKDAGMGLEVGEVSDAQLCPRCGGGQSKERKLYIKRVETGYVYTCHRAKCDLTAGIVGDGSYTPREKGKRTSEKVKFFDYYALSPVPLTEWEYQYLSDMYSIPVEVLMRQGMQWSDKFLRVLLPLKHTDGKQSGFAGRFYPDLVNNPCDVIAKGSKVIDFYKQDENYGFMIPVQKYTGIHSDLVLQEDFFSALRISQHIPCFGLGGTLITNAMAKELMSLKVKRLFICLDADATAKARKMRTELGLLFEEVHIIPLQGVDPKDMTEEQLIAEVINPINKLRGIDNGETDTNSLAQEQG